MESSDLPCIDVISKMLYMFILQEDSSNYTFVMTNFWPVNPFSNWVIVLVGYRLNPSRQSDVLSLNCGTSFLTSQ